MDFNLKQWRYDESASEGHQQQESNIPRFVLDSSNNHLQQQQNSVETALSLFAHEGGGPNTLYNSSCSDNKIPGMGSGGCFSMGQWQELELQASIYRHMIAGSTVPPELLQLVSSSSHHPTSYFHLSSQPLQQFYPHANLVQSGYWGRAAMDPEPGRCRRTDGKKWRCSRDVVPGQKYCERHMNRGKNRSRKPVETNPTSTAATAAGGGDVLNYSTVSQGMNFGSGGGGGTRFTLSGQSPSMDLLHLSQRPKTPFETTTQNDDQNPGGGGRVLRRFFNDWPGSLNHTDNAAGSVTDFSLKLGTGYNNGDETSVRVVNGERESRNHQLNWNYNHNNNTWEANNSYNQVAHMGGPLAEALR